MEGTVTMSGMDQRRACVLSRVDAGEKAVLRERGGGLQPR